MDQCNNSRLSQKPIVHHQNMCPRNVFAHSSCVQFAIHWFNETIWNLRIFQVMKVWSFKGPLKFCNKAVRSEGNVAMTSSRNQDLSSDMKWSGSFELSRRWHKASKSHPKITKIALNPCWNMLRIVQSLSLSIALQIVKDDRPTISVQHLAGVRAFGGKCIVNR